MHAFIQQMILRSGVAACRVLCEELGTQLAMRQTGSWPPQSHQPTGEQKPRKFLERPVCCDRIEGGGDSHCT